VENKQCIFPFKYKGKFYASCTKADTTNGKAWCATEVDDSGTVIDQKWGDCNDDCFTNEAKEECQKTDFFNEAGRCIKRYDVESDLQLQIVRYKIDENYGYETNNDTRICSGQPRIAEKCECNLTKLYGQTGEACEVLPSNE